MKQPEALVNLAESILANRKRRKLQPDLPPLKNDPLWAKMMLVLLEEPPMGALQRYERDCNVKSYTIPNRKASPKYR